MAAGKLSPRQKMINMMYLVLTALLALNVSKEVLDSFFEVNLGIIKTTETVEEKSQKTLLDLKGDKRDKVIKYANLANGISRSASELDNFIQSMKHNLVLSVDGEVYLGSEKIKNKDQLKLITNDPYDKKGNPTQELYDGLSEDQQELNIMWLDNKSSRDASAELFNPENKSSFPVDENGNGTATQLKLKIKYFQSRISNKLREIEKDTIWTVSGSEDIIKEIEALISISDSNNYGKKQKDTWEVYNFKDMPSVAALTLLSKWQADIENVESIVLSFLHKMVDDESYKFTEAIGKAIPSSTFVGSGDQFSAEILVYAYDPTLQGKIYVGDYKVENPDPKNYRFSGGKHIGDLVDGKGLWETRAGGSGTKKYEGYIELEQKGKTKYFPFDGEYTVGEQKAVVSPSYMMAMFKGCDNKIKVSVPGYNSADLIVKFDKGSYKKISNGVYMVNPTLKAGDKGIVSVSAKGKGNLGKVDFKLYPIPPPEVEIDGKVGKTTLSGADIINAQILSASPQKWFRIFEGVQYKIHNFNITVISSKTGVDLPVKGVKRLDDPKAKTAIRNAAKGDRVVIDNIKLKIKGGGKWKVVPYKKAISIKIN